MKALFIFLCIVAGLWTVADIIYFIVISKMKDEAEQDIEKARGIERGNISQAAHLNAKKASLDKREDKIIAEENQMKRKWADLERAQKEYADNLAALEKREKALEKKTVTVSLDTKELEQGLAEAKHEVVVVKKSRKKQ